MQNIIQPLGLSGTCNTRELGGYRTESGLLTATHQLLRSDALHTITQEDGQFLRDYNVRCIIDLRSGDESDRAPDQLGSVGRSAEYVHIPLQDPVKRKRYPGEFPPSMWELYQWMLDDSQTEFRAIFKTISRFPDSCVLFHCTGGKDRTGLLAMLLLKFAGVDDRTVVEDYALTERVMKRLFALQTQELEGRGLTVPPYIMQSPPENMERTLRYLAGQYGTARDYMAHIGVEKPTVDLLRGKILRA